MKGKSTSQQQHLYTHKSSCCSPQQRSIRVHAVCLLGRCCRRRLLYRTLGLNRRTEDGTRGGADHNLKHWGPLLISQRLVGNVHEAVLRVQLLHSG